MEEFQMRDMFNKKNITELANNLKKTYPQFKKEEFLTSILKDLKKYSVIDRSRLITKNLKTFLPSDFKKAATIILKSLPPEQQKDDSYDFIIMPQTYFFSEYGLDHFDLSMKALYELTKRFTSEGAMRYFILKYPKKTLSLLEKWSKDDNHHVRRLVSECTRPRLPWEIQLKPFIKDPRPALKLLENLKEDPELYVRRSVANHINDIAKDNPELAIKTLQKWKPIKNEGTQWLIRHASRTLLKQGHKEALDLLGYTSNPKINITNVKVSKTITQKKPLEFSFTITSNQKQNLMIDYIIHFMKKNKQTAPKVFKLKKVSLKKGETLQIKKSHSFKPISTRTYYKGTHEIELQINGKKSNKTPFNLVL